MKEDDANIYAERYQLISWLKIVDTAMLRLLDLLTYGAELVDVDGKMILNFTPDVQKKLHGLIVDTLNDETYYGKTNILIGACKPVDNWRTLIQKVEPGIFRVEIDENVVSVDMVKLNQFLDSVFSRLRSNKEQLSRKLIVYSHKMLDQYDALTCVNSILSQFGDVLYDPQYSILNLILDGNHAFNHSESLRREIIDDVKGDLIQIY